MTSPGPTAVIPPRVVLAAQVDRLAASLFGPSSSSRVETELSLVPCTPRFGPGSSAPARARSALVSSAKHHPVSES